MKGEKNLVCLFVEDEGRHENFKHLKESSEKEGNKQFFMFAMRMTR